MKKSPARSPDPYQRQRAIDRQGYELRFFRLPNWAVRLSALFNAEVRTVLAELGKERICDASHARDRLGWTPRPAAQSILDTADSLVTAGIVRP